MDVRCSVSLSVRRAGDRSLCDVLFIYFVAVSVVRSPNCGLIKCLHCLRFNPFFAKEAVFVVCCFCCCCCSIRPVFFLKSPGRKKTCFVFVFVLHPGGEAKVTRKVHCENLDRREIAQEVGTHRVCV